MAGFIQIVPAQAIESPCVNICHIDTASGLCEGCARTLHEIGRWTSGTPEWRASVLAQLPHRRASPQASR